jgi:hypothetical protein
MIGLIWLLPAIVLGSAVVFAAAPRLPRRWDAILLQAGLAVGLGLGMASIFFFVCAALGLSRWIALGFELPLTGTLLIARRKREAGVEPPPPGPSMTGWTLWMAATLVLLIAAAALWENTRAQPTRWVGRVGDL